VKEGAGGGTPRHADKCGQPCIYLEIIGRDLDALDAVRQVAKQRREILASDHPRTRRTPADEYQRQKSLKTDLAI
jgi:hypothetical protein